MTPGINQHYSSSFFRRRIQPALERIAAAAALVACSPILIIAGVCIVAESGWPVFFRQVRVGRNGRDFQLYKLRSMLVGKVGARITAGGDARVTRVGAFLRKYKFDELPQFWNIVRGDMQFIGPRPELPSLVNPEDSLWKAVLSEKPGLTDLSTLVHRNEEEILSGYSDPEWAYRAEILPLKLSLSARYLAKRDLSSDFKLLLLTARYSFFPSGFDAKRVLHSFAEDDQ